MKSKLSCIAMLLVLLFAGCDCADTLDVILSVEPPISCVRFDPSPGNQCSTPHLRGANACDVPLIIDLDAETATSIPPCSVFDHLLRGHSGSDYKVRARSGTTELTVTVRQEDRNRTYLDTATIAPCQR